MSYEVDSLEESYPLLASKSSGFEGSGAISSSHESDSGMQSSGIFETKVYKKRWYMLTVFCIIAFVQGLLWNTWSPLGDALLVGFGWTDDFLAFSLAMSGLGIVTCTFPVIYLIEKKDLRVATIFAVVLLVGCTVIWNIAYIAQLEVVFVIGCYFTGVSSCLALAGPPLLSVLWFPVTERTTATAFASMSTHFGIGLGFIVGPFVSGVRITAEEVDHLDNVTAHRKEEIQDGLQRVVYFDTVLAIICFILVLLHFPAKPPTPASRAQAKPRTEHWAGLKTVTCNYQFWILNMAFNVANGTFNAWLPMLSVLFSTGLGLDETVGDWIGFVATIIGCTGSVLIALAVDRHKRHTKRVLQIMSILAISLYVVLSCVQSGYIKIHGETALTVCLYLLVVGIAICMNGGVPLFYELGCEITYPVHEGLSSAYITVFNDFFGLVFYALFFIPGLGDGDSWTTWACLVACVTSFPMLLLLRESYNRLNEESPETEAKEQHA
ncbi:solute carrier family 49 member 4-like [Watersipora subatra]|uniref:solute carrier family 49 member 4-like n=1 Tax=Watersipora subatra TaxID=2589382 RepID=UPI00355BDCE7